MPAVRKTKRSGVARPRQRSYAKSSYVRKPIRKYAAKPAYRYKRRAYAKQPGLGAQVGAWAGDMAQKLLGKITGAGGYKIESNSLLHQTNAQVPLMHSAQDGVRIRHREYLTDINSSVGFSNQSFSVNPGVYDSFPWLSAIAVNFEQYKVHGMMIEFKTTSADALTSTNTALGTIILAAEYNVNNPSYVNKQQMENSMWAMSAKPSECQLMPIECSMKQNPISILYVRNGAVPSGQDARLYDLCNFQVAAVGSQAAAVVGELWISYDIELYKPVLDTGLGLNLDTAHYSLVAPSTSNYFGTSAVSKYDSIGLVLAATVIYLPLGTQGNYLISWSMHGASTASLQQPTVTPSNCTILQIYNNDTTSQIGTATGITGTNVTYEAVINIANPNLGAYLTFSSGTLCGTPTYGDLIIQQLNGNLNA